MPIEDGRRYEHRYHAGNVGDVWKHVVLVALFDHLPPGERRLLVDTHAGAGRYALASTGEWTEGVGALLAADPTGAPRAVTRYLELVGAGAHLRPGARSYPGSPRVLAALADPGDRAYAFELEPAVASELGENLRDAPRVRVERGDGLAALERLAVEAGREGERLVALVDPPYADRGEWQLAPESIARALRASASASIVLWYPVKSWARPNAMLGALERAGVAATAVELLTSPLSSKKNRLNGSGVVLFGPPPGLVEALAGVAAWLGPRLAVGAEGHYTARITGFLGAGR